MLNPRILKPLAGLTLAGGSWIGYHWNKGHLNPGGSHSYDYEWPLGPVENYGSVDEFFSNLKAKPNGSFPMTRVNGTFSQPGDLVHLRFAFETPNPVIVDEIGDRSMTLVAGQGHTFRGSAQHSVREHEGFLQYRIQGQGPAEGGEAFIQQMANVAFGQFGWPLNMPFADDPVVLTHEKYLSDNYR